MSMNTSPSTASSDSPNDSVFDRWSKEIRRTDSGVVSSQSAQIAGSVAVGALVVAGLATGSAATASVVGGLVCGLLMAVSVATIAQNHILSSVVGGLGVLVSGGVCCGLVMATLVTDVGVGGVGIPAVVVGYGVACFWVAGFGNGALGRVLGLLVRVSTILGVTALIATVVWIDLFLVAQLVHSGLTELFVPTTETGTVAGFVVVGWLAVGGCWIAVTALPPASAVPDSIRQQYKNSTANVVSNAAGGIGVGSIIVALLSFVSLQTDVAAGILGPTVDRLVGSQIVRTAFVRLWIAGIVIAVLIVIARAVGAAAIVGSTQWSSAGVVLTSGLFGICVLGAGPLAETLTSISQMPSAMGTVVAVTGPTAVGLALGVAGITAVGTLLFVGVVLAGSGILPSATASPRLAAGGLVWMAIGMSSIESSPWVVFGVVMTAIVVWDVALYGVGVYADLGTTTAHRDGQQIHSVAIIVIGGLAAIGTGLFYRLIIDVRVDDTGVVLGIVLATLVLVSVSLLLRRS